MEPWSSHINRALVTRTEFNEVDFKEDLSEDTTRLKEHINGMAHLKEGGVFVFGVDRNFKRADRSLEPETILSRLANIARDTQEPRVTVEPFTVHTPLGELFCVYVKPAQTRPIFIKDRPPMGGTACFKRSGAATVPMSIEEIRDLLSAARPVGYDESVLSEVEVERLDWSRMKVAMPILSQESDLSSNRSKAVLVDNGLASDVGGRLHPTVAGWLIFGNNPQSVRQFRNASIEFQVFRGITRAEPIKKVEIKGVLPDQIVQAVSVLLQHLWVMPTIVGVRREEIPSYDESILREALTNALVHRDYTKMHQPVKAALFTDRLEIENPGGLMPGLTTMNLVHKRSWRNPLLAERMKKYGHGEMDGQGIDRIYAATRAIHLPAPIFQVSPEAFTVVLAGPKPFADYTPEEKRQTVIVMMILAETIDNESVRQAFGIGMQAASTLLKAMVEEGIVEAVGKGKRFVKYRLTAVYRDRVFG